MASSYVTPYVSQRYQNQFIPAPQPPEVNTLANLIMTGGEAAARNALYRGQVGAQRWNTMGALAYQGLGDVIQRIDEKPKRQFEEETRTQQRKLWAEQNKTMAELARTKELEKNFGSLGLDAEARAQGFEQAGLFDRARQERDEATKREASKWDLATKRLQFHSEASNHVADALDPFVRRYQEAQKGPHGQPVDPTQFEADYQAQLPKILDGLPDDIQKLVPKTFDPTALENTRNTLADGAMQERYRARGIQEANQIRTDEDNAEVRRERVQAALDKLYAFADDDTEWQAIKPLKDRLSKMSPEAVAMYPDTYDQKAQQGARERLQGAGASGKDTYGDLMAQWKQTHPPGQQPSQDEILEMARKASIADRAGYPKPGQGLTTAQLRAAIVKREDTLLKIREAQRKHELDDVEAELENRIAWRTFNESTQSDGPSITTEQGQTYIDPNRTPPDPNAPAGATPEQNQAAAAAAAQTPTPPRVTQPLTPEHVLQAQAAAQPQGLRHAVGTTVKGFFGYPQDQPLPFLRVPPQQQMSDLVFGRGRMADPEMLMPPPIESGAPPPAGNVALPPSGPSPLPPPVAPQLPPSPPPPAPARATWYEGKRFIGKTGRVEIVTKIDKDGTVHSRPLIQ